MPTAATTAISSSAPPSAPVDILAQRSRLTLSLNTFQRSFVQHGPLVESLLRRCAWLRICKFCEPHYRNVHGCQGPLRRRRGKTGLQKAGGQQNQEGGQRNALDVPR
eukprot:712818-Lingulodinium_polyedra.AAC.1